MFNEVLILVGESKKWVSRIVEKMKSLKVGGGLDPGVDIGPVINRSVILQVLSFNFTDI
jgi:malonate-semialdehyde dehydrogenase (acetylating)/methylmalonate-semialdehyde dehydrogenase